MQYKTYAHQIIFNKNAKKKILMRKFYFIQSLKTTDPDLGNQIHSHISKKSQSEFFDVKNRHLFDKLDFISSELEKIKNFGIIHFLHTWK